MESLDTAPLFPDDSDLQPVTTEQPLFPDDSDLQPVTTEQPLFPDDSDLQPPKSQKSKTRGDKDAELLRRVHSEDIKRQAIKEKLEKNATLAKEIVGIRNRAASGELINGVVVRKSPEQVEKEVEKFAKENGYDPEGDNGWLAALGRLASSETFSKVDLERALEEQEEYQRTGVSPKHFSPLQLLESTIGEGVSAWKESRAPHFSNISPYDKKWMEKVNEAYKEPLIKDNGTVNVKAVLNSDLSRKDQNELILIDAAQRTRVSREIWRDVLNRRFGVTEEDGVLATTAKRAAQFIDGIPANLPSRIWARLGDYSPVDRVKAVKELQPQVAITIKKIDGNYYTNNDLPVPSIHPNDSTKVQEFKAWSAIVDDVLNSTEQQAMENWTQVGDLILSLFGVGLGKKAGTITTRLAAQELAKPAAGAVRNALRPVVRAAELTGRGAGKVGAAVEAIMPSAYKATKYIAPHLVTKGEIAGNRGLHLFKVLDKAVMPIATHAALAYAGAPETSGVQQAIGTGLLGTASTGVRLGLDAGLKGAELVSRIPLKHWIEPNNPLSLLSREKGVWAAVIRTPEYDKLPNYVKRRFIDAMDAAGADVSAYKKDPAKVRTDFLSLQAQAKNALEFHTEMQAGAEAWKNNEIDEAGIQQYFDNLANSEKGKAFYDTISRSMSPDDVSVQGRYRKKILSEIENASADHLQKQKNDPKANAADTNTLAYLHKEFERQITEIPSKILNADFPTFMDYLRNSVDERNKKNGNLAFFSNAIENILQSTSDTMAYSMFGMDLAKVYAAVLDAPNPVKLRDLLKYMNNLPEFMNDFVDNLDKYHKTTHNPIQGIEMDSIHPVQTAKALLSDKGTIRDVLEATQGEIQFLIGTQGLLQKNKNAVKEAKVKIKEHVAEYKDILRKKRIQTSLDEKYLQQVADNAMEKAARFHNLFIGGLIDKGKRLPSAREVIFNIDTRNMSDIDKSIVLQVANDIMTKTFSDDDLLLMPTSLRSAVENLQALKTAAAKQMEIQSDAQIRLLYLANSQKAIAAEQAKLGKTNLVAALTGDVPAVYVALRDMMPKLSALLGGDPVFDNLMAAIAIEIDATKGAITIPNNLLGILRMYTNIPMLERLYGEAGVTPPNVTAKEWGEIKKEVNNVADMLQSISESSKDWRKGMVDLADMYQNSTNAIIPMTKQIQYLKDTLFTLKRQQDLEKYSHALFDLIERNPSADNISNSDLKLLVSFAGSSLVERFSFWDGPNRVVPNWIITRKGEADRIFDCLKNQIPAVHKLGLELLTDTMGNSFRPDSYEAAFVSSWFINSESHYDRGGNLMYALALSKVWKDNKDWKYQPKFTALMSTEALKTIMGRDTAMGISRQISEYGIQKTRARVVAEKLSSEFNKELENINIGGVSYTSVQSNPTFVNLIKRMVMGVNGFTKDCYLIVDEIETPQGTAVRKWAESGFNREALIDELRRANNVNPATGKTGLGKNAMPEHDVVKIAGDIEAYFPHNSLELSAKEYAIAFEFARIYQKYDKEKVKLRNRLNETARVRTGKFYPALEYFPKRLGGGSHSTVYVTQKDVNINSPSIRNDMFGRELGTSEAGQIAKTHAILRSEELLHPQEAFLFDTVGLLENVLTRESGNYLQNTVRIFRDSGRTHTANALMGYLLGVNADHRISGITQTVQSFLDNSGFLRPVVGAGRTAASLVSPSMRLLSPVKTTIENALQSLTLGATTNPKSIVRELEALIHSMPLFIARRIEALKNSFQGKNKVKVPEGDVYKTLKFISYVTPPEHNLIISEMLQGLNPKYDAKAAQRMKRINWNSKRWKAIDKRLGDPLQQGYGALAEYTKETFENIMAETRLTQASALWVEMRDKSDKLHADGMSREHIIGEVYRDIHHLYEGALGSNVAAMDMARSVVEGTINGRHDEGFAAFAGEYAHAHLGRYDADNLPPAVKALARWRPGAAQFYNPMTNGFYRLILAAHAAGVGGAGQSNRVVTLTSLAGMVATTGFLVYAAGEFGSPWATRLAPLPMPSSDSEVTIENGLSFFNNPFGTRGGAMGTMDSATYASLIALLSKLAYNEFQKNSETETKAFNEEQQSLATKIWEIVLSTTPLMAANYFVRDVYDVPAMIGHMFYGPDDITEAKERAMEKIAQMEEGNAEANSDLSLHNMAAFLAELETNMLQAIGFDNSNPEMTGNMDEAQKKEYMKSFTSSGPAINKKRLTDKAKKIVLDKRGGEAAVE